MEYDYFPVTLKQLEGYDPVPRPRRGPFSIGNVRVTAQYLNHPALALGYRIEAGGVSVVYSGRPRAPHARSAGVIGAPPTHIEDRRHVDLLADADLVIHDAQYTVEEYPQKTGWGHTPAEWAVDYGMAAHARRLALFHHDPLRADDALDDLVEVCRARASAAGSDMEVFAAREGQTVHLAEGEAGVPHPGPAPAAAVQGGTHTVLVADDDPTIVQLLTLTLSRTGSGW
jgi:phosphoribosyl 1,2-cyclic phosphodiesterase